MIKDITGKIRRSACIVVLSATAFAASAALGAATAAATAVAPTAAVGARAASSTTNADSAYDMARLYSGQTGKAFDRQKAYDYTRTAAELGHTQAQTDLAFIYFNGNDRIPKDLAQSFTWFGRAAAGGSVISQCMLGDFYRSGLGGAPQDDKQAFRWYSATATKDDRCAPKSQYRLYEAYASGRGVPKDMPKAVTWLKRAADAGNMVAQARLGRAYLKGEGVPLDDAVGRAWLKKSREGVAPHEDEDDHAHDHGARAQASSGQVTPKTGTPAASAHDHGGPGHRH